MGVTYDTMHSLHPWEEEIMDLWDEGRLSVEQIASRVGRSLSHVDAVVRTYSEGVTDRWAIHARMATARLADAPARAA